MKLSKLTASFVPVPLCEEMAVSVAFVSSAKLQLTPSAPPVVFVVMREKLTFTTPPAVPLAGTDRPPNLLPALGVSSTASPRRAASLFTVLVPRSVLKSFANTVCRDASVGVPPIRPVAGSNVMPAGNGWLSV